MTFADALEMRRAQAHGGSSPSASANLLSLSPARPLGRFGASYICSGEGDFGGAREGIVGTSDRVGGETA